jgi:cellobiose transport system substrate-binding protein
LAGVASIALIAGACSSNGTPEDETTTAGEESAGPAEPVTLTVNVFGNAGYEGDADGNNNLFRLYEDQNPGVTIEETNLGQGGDALTVVLNAIGAGGVGLPDVQMIEEGWRVQMMGLTDSFVDLRDFGAEELQDRWLDWKWESGIAPDGKVFLYGTDIGPQGLCFDLTQIQAAGIANDRDEFAEALGGDDATWDEFWTVGEEYTAATGKPFIGVPAFAWNSFVNQQAEGYYKADGTLNVLENTALKDFLGKIVEESQAGVAGKINSWSWANEDFHGNFAVQICPGWMLGSISEAVGSGSDTWDFADVFPGGATNWGGSYFSVPAVSEHQEEAAKLAAWLTSPETQIIAFQNAGAFPSQVDAFADPAVTGFTNELFNDAPVGEILAHRAEGVVPQFKGEKDSVIQDTVFGGVITELNAGQITSIDQAWERLAALLDENDVS